MAPYTLTVREAETRLRDLVAQAQATRRPVFLTAEESAEPMAVVLAANDYVALSADPALALTRRLNELEGVLDLLHNRWEVQAVRRAFPRAWRWHLEGVWEAGQHRELPFRQLIVLLQMAAEGLDMGQFTRSDLAVWRACLQVLQQPSVTLDDLARCDEALIQHGFPVLLHLDDSGLALYVTDS